MRTRLFLGCATLLLAQFAHAGIIVNGGFETNDGLNSFGGWLEGAQAGGQNNWWAQSETNAPVNAFTVPAPPEGRFAAMTDGPGPSSEVLLQGFTVPLGVTSVVLSFDYFILSPASDFINPDSLDFTAGPNQQARVDILDGGAGPFDLDAAVVLSVLQTNPGDPNGTSATTYTALVLDITNSVTPGSTYLLRFAEVETQGQLLFGVDDVQINATTTPEPAVCGAILGGLLLMIGAKRLRS